MLIPRKAEASDYLARFREIISDPINLLIQRHPLSGFVEDDHVFLHNGLRVPIKGPNSYYDEFSEILIINRGVHEPLEEYIFSLLVHTLPLRPVMLELGAYWGHYSMWLKISRSKAKTILVEPDGDRLMAGKYNFNFNGLNAAFLQATIGHKQSSVKELLADQGVDHLDILHADIQGAEEEMLIDAYDLLKQRSISYCFVSTHSQALHRNCTGILESAGYRIEASSDYDYETTSFDGLIFASSPNAPRLLDKKFAPLKRAEIAAGNDCKSICNYLMNASASQGVVC